MGLKEDNTSSFGTMRMTLADFKEQLFNELFLISHDETREQTNLSLAEARLPLFTVGTPGLGKTAVVAAAKDEINNLLEKEGSPIRFGFKKIQLGQTQVGELQGIPLLDTAPVRQAGDEVTSIKDPNAVKEKTKASGVYAVDSNYKNDGSGKGNLPSKSDRRRVVRVQMEDLPDKDIDGEYGILFLDELTTADEAQMQPALGLCDDSRNIGTYKLPEHWLVVGAGNGIDCTNFIRFDDATISRFMIFDLAINYETDWRPWAHSAGIHPDIIAFLNFKPGALNEIQSEETDVANAGKQFTNPRTWTALNTLLKQRDALNRPIPQDKIAQYASTIIGIKWAREFESFLKYKVTSNYDTDKIMEGEEKSPKDDRAIKQETVHIVVQSLISKMQQYIEVKLRDGDVKNWDAKDFDKLVNPIKWILDLPHTDMVLNYILEIINEVPEFKTQNILFDPKFCKACPEFDNYIEENTDIVNALLQG